MLDRHHGKDQISPRLVASLDGSYVVIALRQSLSICACDMKKYDAKPSLRQNVNFIHQIQRLQRNYFAVQSINGFFGAGWEKF